MDYQYKPRRTGKDKERRNRELYGNHSAKHVRIQEKCQENHLKNIQEKKAFMSTSSSSNKNKHSNQTNNSKK
jgi:hypothetical protein